LSYLHSNTLDKNRQLVWNCFVNVCSGANKVFAFDADYGVRAHTFVEDVRGDVNVIINRYKSNPNSYYSIKEETDFRDKYQELLSQNKRIVIPINNKAKAKEIELDIGKAFPNKIIIIYTAESDEKDKANVADCNNIWIKCDVLIYTPTISSAVDFNPTDEQGMPAAHFDCILAFAMTNSNTAREFMQMIGRIRHLKMNEVLIFVDTPRTQKHEAESPQSIRKRLEANWFSITKRQRFSPLESCSGKLDMCDENYLNVYLYNKSEIAKSNNRFAELLFAAIREKGGNYRGEYRANMSNLERLDSSTEILEREEAVSDSEANRILNAFPKTKVEADQSKTRKDNNIATEDDKYILHRQAIIKQWSLNVPLIGDYSNEDQRKAMLEIIKMSKQAYCFYNFVLLMQPLKTLPKEFEKELKAKRNIPIESKHILQYRQVELLKGLLICAGFSSSADASPSDPDRADICSTNIMRTDKIRELLTEDKCNWLDTNVADIKTLLHATLSKKKGVYQPGDTIIVLRRVLQHFTGIDILKVKTEKVRIGRGPANRKSCSQWQLSGRDLILELAYSNSRRNCTLFNTWPTVKEDLLKVMKARAPPFLFSAATGVDPPYEVSSSAPPEFVSKKDKTRKRKHASINRQKDKILNGEEDDREFKRFHH